MRELLEADDVPGFLDETAQRFLAEARIDYAAKGLAKGTILDQGHELLLITWLGDASNEAIACLLNHRGLTAQTAGLGVEVMKLGASAEEIVDRVLDIASEDFPDVHVMLEGAKNLQRAKWDWALPEGLLRESYASLYLNLEEAGQWLRALAEGFAD